MYSKSMRSIIGLTIFLCIYIIIVVLIFYIFKIFLICYNKYIIKKEVINNEIRIKFK